MRVCQFISLTRNLLFFLGILVLGLCSSAASTVCTGCDIGITYDRNFHLKEVVDIQGQACTNSICMHKPCMALVATNTLRNSAWGSGTAVAQGNGDWRLICADARVNGKCPQFAIYYWTKKRKKRRFIITFRECG